MPRPFDPSAKLRAGSAQGKPYVVTKVIDFCYGHRLLNYEGKCRHLHGHNGRVEIDIATEGLDKRGMAYDFSDIKQAIKSWIDKEFDHKMLLNEKDPVISYLKERNEPLYIFQENPTAENIAKKIFEEAVKLGFPVEEVRLWETSDSYATYRKDKF
ncbi:MAG: 6-pyruvoyl tetrahydrobiopterin synthase [Deltaproteobacteria bacterium RIFCSPLOWO2_01_44_7]|nr:MAG: 6-pyruvoyl tetrahydrobiopterin synthase [Deltaproteobacteria bacterium RIFCSPHIGHO2_01_FULL_43_49]OGQ15337.1 MAG: 6-pyruvoyl tetrahydrobiopterin synthase [Deltaproteobacteria bacterium RIFCSPHIGHO2_02_FULL_44_53]OGQ27360.1 MAG: 6-pyruvoyl tetrahydrobiopterin synthase [Deltaproteobacteria bacterium RIFCSPHIGHO2_12_FULL_44_21]OGQ31854.1 MAG: 6-pyruvoyl tetrahydrobiopterin synthase [Deltaproteobacteria bacterium RIFCSPLOWO2_01_FULL_45_74]OGQ37647.1 MAG: 6-pyruvoyl tetrahydrobiopterin synth